jgi:hypothetical protein
LPKVFYSPLALPLSYKERGENERKELLANAKKNGECETDEA